MGLSDDGKQHSKIKSPILTSGKFLTEKTFKFNVRPMTSQKNSKHLIHCTTLLVAAFFGIANYSWAADKSGNVPIEKTLGFLFRNHLFVLRPQPNHSGTLYVQIGTNEYICKIEHSALFPLSHDLERVKIVSIATTIESEVLVRGTTASGRGAANQVVGADDITFDTSYLQFSLKHETLGRGKILIGRSDGVLPSSTNDIFSVLGFVFKGASIPVPKLFVTSSSSNVAHYAASGHATLGEKSIYFANAEEALSGGFQICSLCLNSLIKLPMLGLEMSMGRETEAAARHNVRIFDSPVMLDRVSRMGRKVINGWPTMLKGYNYRFSLLDDSSLNAQACPGGYIFVNRGLLEALESDDELEALLAHEIAHVEQRHGLMQYLNAQRNARNAVIFTTIMTAGIGAAAAANGNQDAATIASAGGQISLLLASIAAQIASSGYSKQHEQEADIYALIYLQSHGKSKSHLLSLLKKLRTSQEIKASINGENLVNTSHPSIKERLFAAQSLEVRTFNGSKTFDAFEKDGDLLYSLTLNAQARFQKRDGREIVMVLGEISTMATIGESETFGQLKISKGKQNYAFDTDGDVKIGPLETHAVSFRRAEADLNFIEGDFLPSLDGIKAAKIIQQ